MPASYFIYYEKMLTAVQQLQKQTLKTDVLEEEPHQKNVFQENQIQYQKD